MKTIIAGSRNITNVNYLYTELPWPITEVISGGARGVDTLGEQWAFEHGIPVKRFPANWSKFGRGAGHIRNAEMALYADALIAIWDGVSPGTGNMINLARSKSLKIHVEMV